MTEDLSMALVPYRMPINASPTDDDASKTDDDDTAKEELVKFLEDFTNLTSLDRKKFRPCANKLPSPEPPHQDISTSSSRWEFNKMKVDLIAAKAQITQLEARIDQQDRIHRKMELLFEGEKLSLIEQHKRDQKDVASMKERMEVISRRDSYLKEDSDMAVIKHRENKLKWDIEKVRLNKVISQLKDEMLEAKSSHNSQMSETRKDLYELAQGLEGFQAEVKILKEELEKQTTRAKQFTTTRIQLEKNTLELQLVTNKVRQLEYERDSCNDWQQQAKTAQNRLFNMAELEKEVLRLRATERSLREAIGNKLILEEQVHLLSSKVESTKLIQQKLHDCEVKLAHAETSLEELNAIAKVHGLCDARALATAFEDALLNQLSAVSDCVQAQSQVSQLNEEVTTLKYERDKATALLADKQNLRQAQESLIHRLQKRLSLTTRELNSYKKQLDCCEKELAVTLCGESGVGNVALQSARVEQLETALQGYRDLVATYDQEAHMVESLRADVAKFRDEAAIAQREESLLRTQRDRLQAQLLTLSDKSTTNDLANNPSATAQTLQQFQADLEAAQEEIKRLKAALQEGDGRVVVEDSQLRQQLEDSDTKLQRMEEEFISAQEYREVYYLLSGYNIDRIESDMYRITNIYASSAEEYLLFRRCENSIEMLHTDYSATLGELLKLHLHHNSSVPVFLSALTMQLCTRITVQQEDMDVITVQQEDMDVITVQQEDVDVITVQQEDMDVITVQQEDMDVITVQQEDMEVITVQQEDMEVITVQQEDMDAESI